MKADEWIVSYTALGKTRLLLPGTMFPRYLMAPRPFWFLFKQYAASPAGFAAASLYIEKLQKLLETGKVFPILSRPMTDGLVSIGNDFEKMRAGTLRGEKIMYGGETGM